MLNTQRLEHLSQTIQEPGTGLSAVDAKEYVSQLRTLAASSKKLKDFLTGYEGLLKEIEGYSNENIDNRLWDKLSVLVNAINNNRSTLFIPMVPGGDTAPLRQ